MNDSITKTPHTINLPACEACGMTTMQPIRVRPTPSYTTPIYDYDQTAIVPPSPLQHDTIPTYDDACSTFTHNTYNAIESTQINTSRTTATTLQTPLYTSTTSSAQNYYGYRYYSTNLGRWINRDPIEEAGGVNVYGFLGNRPAFLVDAHGLSSLFISNNEGVEQEVRSIRDIVIRRVLGRAGSGFQDRIRWVIGNPPQSFEDAINDPTPVVVCDFKFSLNIVIAHNNPIVSGRTYFYKPHVMGNDGIAVGNGPYAAARVHELGHAYAYWVNIKQCAERIHQRWGGRTLTSSEQSQVRREYQACKNHRYWQDSAKYANEWERNYYDVTASDQFRRIFPSNRSDIGRMLTSITYGGRTFRVTDIWKAR